MGQDEGAVGRRAEGPGEGGRQAPEGGKALRQVVAKGRVEACQHVFQALQVGGAAVGVGEQAGGGVEGGPGGWRVVGDEGARGQSGSAADAEVVGCSVVEDAEEGHAAQVSQVDGFAVAAGALGVEEAVGGDGAPVAAELPVVADEVGQAHQLLGVEALETALVVVASGVVVRRWLDERRRQWQRRCGPGLGWGRRVGSRVREAWQRVRAPGFLEGAG